MISGNAELGFLNDNEMHVLVFQYKATDLVFPGPGKFEVVFTPEGGSPQTSQVFTFKNGGGCGLAMYNTDEVLQYYANMPMQYAAIFIGCKNDNLR